MQTTPVETPDRRTHPYASLVDAVRAVLRPYYRDPWLTERANNLAQACGEPDIRLRDIEQMLRASGDRPEPQHLERQGIPAFSLSDYSRMQLAGNVLAAALGQINRRLRLEVL